MVFGIGAGTCTVIQAHVADLGRRWRSRNPFIYHASYVAAASTTEPGQRMAKSYAELQMWKRQLVKADTQLRNFEASTQRERCAAPARAVSAVG